MEIYLPMVKRVRTKVQIFEGRIVSYQQKRCSVFFPIWRKIETTEEIFEYVAARLNHKVVFDL